MPPLASAAACTPPWNCCQLMPCTFAVLLKWHWKMQQWWGAGERPEAQAPDLTLLGRLICSWTRAQTRPISVPCHQCVTAKGCQTQLSASFVCSGSGSPSVCCCWQRTVCPDSRSQGFGVWGGGWPREWSEISTVVRSPRLLNTFLSAKAAGGGAVGCLHSSSLHNSTVTWGFEAWPLC